MTVDDETTLAVEWHAPGLELSEEQRAEVLERLPQLEKAVRDFPVRLVHVEVEQNVRKGGWGISVNLQLPRKSLFAAEWEKDLGYAGRQAMNKVITQVSQYRSMLRRHERRSHRGEFAEERAGAERSSLEAERETLEGLRDRISRLVRKEIVHDANLVELPKEAISVPDVVDEAMVWTFEHLGDRPPYLSPEQYLWRRVLHQLDLARNSVLRHRAGDEAKERLAAAHAESDVEVDMEWEDAQDLIFGGGERLPLDFGESTASDADPANNLDRETVQSAVSEALKDLPEVQRRAVLLHDLEGYDPAEIAYVLSRTEERVREDLETARGMLRERLGGLMA